MLQSTPAREQKTRAMLFPGNNMVIWMGKLRPSSRSKGESMVELGTEPKDPASQLQNQVTRLHFICLPPQALMYENAVRRETRNPSTVSGDRMTQGKTKFLSVSQDQTGPMAVSDAKLSGLR